MKTPEEILDQYLHNYPWQYWAKENAIKAMNAYADQFLQEVNKNFQKHLLKIETIRQQNEEWDKITGQQIQENNERE